jgi:hypothetical protein
MDSVSQTQKERRLYTIALNEVFDLHSSQVTVGFQYRIPGIIWLALYFVTIMAMAAVGYHFGISEAGNYWITLVLALAFSAVIILIADLDRPTEGLLKVSQKPMYQLHQKMSPSAK